MAKAVEYENTRVTSNVLITDKNEKQYVRLQLSIPGTQGATLNKVTPDTDVFTKEQVVHQCDAQIVENTVCHCIKYFCRR